MGFNGREGAMIKLPVAANLTENYRTKNGTTELGAFYGKDIINELLEQDGCMGVRIYYGLNDNGSKEMVIVGVDADENDILTDGAAKIADNGLRTPPITGTLNSLNS